MQDFIPKGNGNSRSLKSSIPNGTTWEQALEMLRNGTFPIDIGAANEAGVLQKGNPLNKSTLLKDETAALFKDLPKNPVPDDVFKILSKAAIVTGGGLRTPSGGEVPGLVTVYGTYTGTGAQSVTLNFGFRPDVVLVGGHGKSTEGVITLLRGVTQNQIIGSLNSYCFYFSNVSWGETSVTWGRGDSTIAEFKANTSGQTYHYWALGVKQ